MKKAALKAILFYKKYISGLKNGHCRFVPTCSMYTYEAIQKYGVIAGCIKGGIRILKCGPFTKHGGFAPVKENFRGDAKWLI
ncbi:MAG: membrane protein insertion efficiency factor YidD [Clostridiales bacterium]|jgi:putative membrane protein insertion efficiency factor|nr:membrane protein insertion efficiency factor YidD [Clostridiales bacterium]